MEWAFLLVIPMAAAAVVNMVWRHGRSRAMLDGWAVCHGYRLLSCENRRLRRGPFFLVTSRRQEVYRVAIQDRAGNVRHGYVRCGGAFQGLLSDNVDVRWDPEPPHRPGFPVVFPARPKGPDDPPPDD